MPNIDNLQPSSIDEHNAEKSVFVISDQYGPTDNCVGQSTSREDFNQVKILQKIFTQMLQNKLSNRVEISSNLKYSVNWGKCNDGRNESLSGMKGIRHSLL